MALKSVKICDVCGAQESPDSKVIDHDGRQDLCFACAYANLRTAYGLEPDKAPPSTAPASTKVEPPVSADTKAFLARRAELQAEHGGEVYPIKPSSPVNPGSVIEYGNPPRRVEVLEPLAGRPGEWFGKILMEDV